jgi:hypothetical protein
MDANSVSATSDDIASPTGNSVNFSDLLAIRFLGLEKPVLVMDLSAIVQDSQFLSLFHQIQQARIVDGVFITWQTMPMANLNCFVNITVPTLANGVRSRLSKESNHFRYCMVLTRAIQRMVPQINF